MIEAAPGGLAPMSMVRTRFAPSPTGSLHVGGARTALYCWVYAKQKGGRFLLRIEDTDQARSTEEAAAGILRDMRWLGLDWDEGPDVGGPHGSYYQSRRLATYDAVVERLLASGKAYEAWESTQELAAMRADAESRKQNFRFTRPGYTDADLARFRAEGRVPVVRLVSATHPVVIQDDVLGEMTQQADELEDFVIRKADGFPTYHLAVVCDDHAMEITHVLRGQEHFMNTAKHLQILEALGWHGPRHAHLPIIFNPSGSKMSKRDKARVAREAARAKAAEVGAPKGDWAWLAVRTGLDEAALRAFMAKENDGVDVATRIGAALDVQLPMIEVMDFRRAGYLPEALLNYLALLGWSAGDDRERYTLEELAAAFSVERVNRQPAKFDPVKLEAMNADWLRSLPHDRLLALLHQWFEVVDSPLARLTDEALDVVVRLFQSRARTLVDLDRQSAFLRAAPRTWSEAAVTKHVRKGDGLLRLDEARKALADLGSVGGRPDGAGVRAALRADGRQARELRAARAGGDLGRRGHPAPVRDVGGDGPR
jgi:glutamyl/glutaminyl-tRNA synthetase